jgi:hypothetical protein
LTGIAIGMTTWMYGCRRIVVQPEESKDGKPVDTFCVDEPQLDIMKKGVMKSFAPPQDAAPEQEQQRRHGPRPDAQRRQDVRRIL